MNGTLLLRVFLCKNLLLHFSSCSTLFLPYTRSFFPTYPHIRIHSPLKNFTYGFPSNRYLFQGRCFWNRLCNGSPTLQPHQATSHVPPPATAVSNSDSPVRSFSHSLPNAAQRCSYFYALLPALARSFKQQFLLQSMANSSRSHSRYHQDSQKCHYRSLSRVQRVNRK